MKNKDKIYIFCIISIIILSFLSIVDLILTLSGIYKYGIEVEGNYIVKYIIQISPLIFIFLKTICPIILFVSIFVIKRNTKIKYKEKSIIFLIIIFINLLFIFWFLYIDLEWIYFIF